MIHINLFKAWLSNFDAFYTFFGSQCWLKKQKDTLNPDQNDSGDQVFWTSGLIFGKGEVQNLQMHGLVSAFNLHIMLVTPYL